MTTGPCPEPSDNVTEFDVLLSSRLPCVSVIVACEAPSSKTIALALVAAFAASTADRNVPALPSSAVLVTSKVDRSWRFSKNTSSGTKRRECLRLAHRIRRAVPTDIASKLKPILNRRSLGTLFAWPDITRSFAHWCSPPRKSSLHRIT